MSKEFGDSGLYEAGFNASQIKALRHMQENAAQFQADEFFSKEDQNRLLFVAFRNGYLKVEDRQADSQAKAEDSVPPEQAERLLSIVHYLHTFVADTIHSDPTVEMNTMDIGDGKLVSTYRASHRGNEGVYTYRYIKGGILDGTVEAAFDPDDPVNRESITESAKINGDGSCLYTPPTNYANGEKITVNTQPITQAGFIALKQAGDLLVPYLDFCTRRV